MATTWMKSLHVNKGKSIAQTLADRMDYADNPEKTKEGELVTGYGCDPPVADEQFLLAKKEYAEITGRNQGGHNVIAYHIRQSFKPGEVSPEEANQIGYELAARFFKGKHAYVVATHIDKDHALSSKRCFQHTSYLFSATAPVRNDFRLRRNTPAP